MKITLSREELGKTSADMVAIGLREGAWKRDPRLLALVAAGAENLISSLEDEEFSAKRGETLRLPLPGKTRWLLLVGLGSAAPSTADARLLGVKLAAGMRGQSTAALSLEEADAETIRAASEGLTTGAYRFTRYLSSARKPKKRSVQLLLPNLGRLEKAEVDKGVIVGECINMVRDLVNAPPNDMHPIALADFAKAEAEKYGVACKVLNKKQIEREGMELLLAVNRGSGIEPRFVHLHYKPKKKGPRIVFVGKGLTFDSGGLCLKPAKSMIDMKCDMAGAAVTIAAVLGAARLGLAVEVHGVIAATENMGGEHAFRPGDIFRSLEGKSVEIINTDAEGRLVLADALTWARRLQPDLLIDHATLTGACMVALGQWTAGFFANDENFGAAYLDAARVSNESMWRLPLTDDLRETLKSEVADLKHTGDGYGGAISAALFLQEFVGKVPWMHVDIAGPAFLSRPHGTSPSGGTGFGVAAALRFLEQQQARAKK